MTDITSISDAEFRREASRRERAAREARHLEQVERWRQEHEAQEAKDREFAAGLGITWEQFQAAEDYLSDKFRDAQ